MGVRLVIHNFEVDEMDYTGTHNHDDLLHRDWVDQHPIYAITGLQEVLNTIETNLINITNLINSNNINVIDKIIDTESIDLTYNQATKSLKADVIIYDDPEGTNSLVCTSDGLYVPKLVTKDTDTITWNSVSQGESLAAQDIFANVKIQEEPHNAIQVNENGLFVQEFLVSPDANNALSHHDNGYYVKATAMSTAMNIADQRLNGLEQLSSGEYYVHKSHSFIDVTQTNHKFIVGDFIYYDNITNLYQKAIAKDDFCINIVGMVSYIYDTNKFEYVCSGFVETDLFTEENGYVQGMPLYISDSYAGQVTQEQPDISKAVGYPVADLGLIISIERGIQYEQEAQIGDFKTSANDYTIRSDGFIKIAENIDYKLSLINKLLDNVDDNFKEQYLIINETNNVLNFTNVKDLYESNNVPDGLNLFIKAF